MSKSLLKVAFFDGYHEAFYGSHQSLFTLVTHLDREKYDPVFVTTDEGIVADRFRSAGVETKILKPRGVGSVFGKAVLEFSLIQKGRAAFDVMMHNLRVLRWLKKQDVRVVYVNDLRSMIFAGLSARLAGLPLLWYVRDDYRHGQFQALALRLATRVFVIADGVKRAFTAAEQRKYKEKFVTLFTGFDFSKYEYSQDQREAIRSELGIPLAADVVGIVGSITPRKGYEVLAEAAPAIAGDLPSVYFLAAGGSLDGGKEYVEHVRSLISSAGLQKRFVWCGYRKDVETVIAAMDVLVLPSRSEGLPRTVIEALACGKSAVATDVGGVREIIVSSVHGQVIDVDDSQALADAVRKILMANLRDPASAESRKAYVKRKFSLNAYVRNFERELDKLTA